MKVLWADDAWDDYIWWEKHDKQILNRINKLIENISKTPFSGIGKPESLKHGWSGYWSRRITEEHRLVYKTERKKIFIAQCRYHY